MRTITVLLLAQTAWAVNKQPDNHDQIALIEANLATLTTKVDQFTAEQHGNSLRGETIHLKEIVIGLREEVTELKSSNSKLMTELQGLKAEVLNLKNNPEQTPQAISKLVPFWSEWSEYSSCSASCGAGLKSRTRICDTPATRCSGPLQEQDQCNSGLCPVWSEWSDFSPCSVSCGLGSKRRNRTCETPEIGCPGSDFEVDSCNEARCPEILLVAGGTGNSAEVLGLNDESVECGISVPDLPVKGDWGSFFKHWENPVFCGAHRDSPCFKYSSMSNTWERFTKLTGQRESAAAVVHANGSVLIAGGQDDDAFLSTSDYWNPVKEQFETGIDLPQPAGYPCIAAINETHSLLTGGYGHGNRNEAFMLNSVTGQWTPMGKMQKKRHGHACGLVGQKKIVVAGGYDGGVMSSAEVFDLATHTWRPGPELPFPIAGATSVQVENTFLLVGGKDDKRHPLNTVHTYDIEHNNWRIWEQKLKVARKAAPAVYRLLADYLNCA